jgi:hypothetical protein
MKALSLTPLVAALLFLVGCATPSGPASQQSRTSEGYKTYDQGTVTDEAEKFFGGTTAGLAQVIDRTFTDNGRPQAYIAGEEAAGAAGVGLRYGKGYLYRPGAAPVQVYWRGPSIGFDGGGNASKVFTLVYDLGPTDNLFKRYPGVDGSAYYVGGAGVNYQRSGRTVLAPVRTGVGLRAGVNIGYLAYSRDYKFIPF